MRNIIVAIATLTICMTTFAQNRKLEKGEILYRGTTKLEKCDEATISFVLSAKRDTIKNFSFELNDIYIKEKNGSLKKVTTKMTYDAFVEVKDGVVDYTYPWRGEKWQIAIKKDLGEETVLGEVKCIYVVGNDQIEDLGTATVEFKKVELKKD